MKRFLTYSLLIAILLLVGAAVALSQGFRREPQLTGRHAVIPWTAGTQTAALVQASVLSTIPMFNYTYAASKNSTNYSGVMVGRSPFDRGKTVTQVSVKIIPVTVNIGIRSFNPTTDDTCTPGANTTVQLVQGSPLFATSSLSFNGVSVGTRQYIDGYRAAEFWNQVGGTAYGTTLNLTVLNTYTLAAGTHGTTYNTGTCTRLGIVAFNWLDTTIRNTILPSYGTQLGPTDFVFILFRNVVQSTVDPPNVSNCCILGYHSASGTPVQTYGTAFYDYTGLFGAGTTDISAITHEIAEWLDDPLGTNPTPAWGGIGQVSGCQSNLENGDPLTGTLAPAITMGNGVTYHPQELVYFSWFFNSQATASFGTGGKFSSNGTFQGPSKVCPAGGTF